MPSKKSSVSRFPSSVVGTYSLRILLGWVASVGLILLLVRLPLSASSPRLGWTSRPAAEWLSLTQTSPETTEPEQKTEDPDPPQATRHAPPEPAAATDSSGAGTDEAQASTSSPSPDTTTVRPIADLSVKDRTPEIIGGRGTLGLHIAYPPEARKKGIEGRLTLTFTVDPEGIARNIVVVDSLHPACDSAAVAALQSVRFRPGTYNGEPVPVRMSLPVRFELQPSRRPSPSTRRSTGD